MIRHHLKWHLSSVLIVCVLAVAFGGEVIYERQPTEAEKEKYEIVSGGGTYFPAGVTYEQARQQILQQTHGPHDRTLKLVLEKDDKQDGRLICRVTRLGEMKADVEARKRWSEEGPKRLGIGDRVVGLKRTGRHGFAQGWTTIFLDDARLVYWVGEDFYDPKLGKSGAMLMEVREQTIPPHELMRQLTGESCRTARMAFGTVVVAEAPKPKVKIKGLPEDHHQRVSWLSGDHLVVYLWAQGEVPKELLDLYGGTYPSGLAKDFAIDKTAWGREEFELWLGRMKRLLEGKDWRENDDPLSGTDWFYNYLGAIRRKIFVPSLEARDWTKGRPAAAERKGLYDELAAWWDKYKAETYWDDDLKKLVAKSLTPAKLAEAAAKAAEIKARQAAKLADEERQKMLATPLTPVQVEELVKGLVKSFDDRLKGRADSFKELFGERGEGVKLERMENNRWVLTRPGPISQKGAVLRDTYTGPEIIMQDSRESPIKAVFKDERVNSAFPAIKNTSEVIYIYSRTEKRWRMK